MRRGLFVLDKCGSKPKMCYIQLTSLRTGPESLECALFSLDEIPFDSISFSSIAVALKIYIEDVKAGQIRSHHGVTVKRPFSKPIRSNQICRPTPPLSMTMKVSKYWNLFCMDRLERQLDYFAGGMLGFGSPSCRNLMRLVHVIMMALALYLVCHRLNP